MPNRKRRANGSSGRPQRRVSSAESLPPQTRSSPRPHARSAHANEFDVLRHHRSTSIGPSAPFQRRPRAHSISGTATAFKASIHSNPYLASRCRTLKSQTTFLKQKLEELVASVEELQPDQTAMDWAASAGTVIYVPARVTRDNEAPRVSLAHPEAKGPERSTFPDSSQYSKKTDNCFGFGNATNPLVCMSFGQTQQQAQAGQTGWGSPIKSRCPFPGIGGQVETVPSMDASKTARPLLPVPVRSTDYSILPRHAYVEDNTPQGA